MKFLHKAVNRMAYAKIGIYGEAGSGKTFTAANIAVGLHQYAKLQKPVAMFDTEPAASYIIPLFEQAGIDFYVFDQSRALVDLQGFIEEAEKECSIVIIDSISHVWREAQDAYLKKINDGRAKQLKPPIYQLEFHHWRPIKSAWQQFTDRYLSSKVHAIVCGRAGSIYEYQENDRGKKELITTGTKMATEKEMGYEPSLLIEMIKHREGGRIVNRALVEKDRANKLNGHEIDYPSFESFKPHFDFLNIGGQHFDSMNQRNSCDMYTDEGDDNWSAEKRKREIACENIKSIFIRHDLDGASSKAKKERNEIMHKIFNTGSWTEVENMRSSILIDKINKLNEFLEPATTAGKQSS